MSNFPFPPVTLEDLQAFQAKHFPGQPQHTPTFQDTYDEQDLTEEADDDLGYYPDGVKRTLTDEQIRIFRHSEIHSLLREREVEAENEAFDNPPADEDMGDEKGNDGADTSAERQNGVTNSSTSEDSGVKQARIESQANVDSEAGALDYGEDGPGQNNQQPKNANTPRSAFAGRRIISYAD